jgi:hypothetical protein
VKDGHAGRAGTPTGYLFVVGCPRSGTTAITKLLHAHSAIVLGSERYKDLLNTTRRTEISPFHFTPERFLDFRPEDTNITPEHTAFTGHYAEAAERFERGSVRYVGDKLGLRKPAVRIIEKRFPDARWVFIYRDLLAVANSYCVRAANPRDAWSSESTHEHALTDWSDAFERADDLIERHGTKQVFVVRYEQMFSGDVAACEALFEFLGLAVTRDVRRRLRHSAEGRPAREARPPILTDEQRRFLLERMDPSVPARYDALYAAQRASRVAPAAPSSSAIEPNPRPR